MFRFFRFATSILCFAIGIALIISGPIPFIRAAFTDSQWYFAAALSGIVGGAAVVMMALRDNSNGGVAVGLVYGTYTVLISLLLFVRSEFVDWLVGGLSGCWLVVIGWALFQGPEKFRTTMA